MNNLSVDEREILKAMVIIAPYIKNFIQSDIGISVIEGDTYLSYIPAEKLDLGLKPGDKLKKGILADQAMKQNRKLSMEYTRENSPFGVPYIAICWPVRDKNGMAIGCIVSTETTDSIEFIRNAAENLNSSTEHLTHTIIDMGNQVENLVQATSELNNLSDQITNNISNTDEIVNFIREIAKQTNLIGLNAAIEAARVGDMGRGFGVVADEVRKLAANSSLSVEKISGFLSEIQKSIGSFNKQSQTIEQFVKHHAAIVQEIASASEQLNAMAQELKVSTLIEND